MANLENITKFKPGTRIFYTGDRANLESYGTITGFNPPDAFCGCGSVDIEYDNPRFDGDLKIDQKALRETVDRNKRIIESICEDIGNIRDYLLTGQDLHSEIPLRP